MGSNSSGEDLVVKARKPYTISKQREPWTEEEHNRFLEALKLYGRAWQRIEEHIGTKTAVQIRSHAQKFFSKLEKEALTKGVSLGKTLDIEIPPPRPKRKPCSPYPRKTGTGSLCPTREAADEKPSESASSPINNKQLLDSKSNDPREIPVANESFQTRNEASQDVGCSEVLNLFHDAYSASISSSNKASSIASSCGEFLPLMKVIEEKTAVEKNDTSDADPDSGKLHGAKSQTKPAQVESTDELKQSERQHPSSKGNPFLNTTAFATPDTPSYSEVSSIYQSFPPFTQSQRNQDAYRSIHSIPSTLSNLIVATLLQNPAVHAAATLTATSFFPPPGMDCLINSSSNISPGEMPPRHMNPSPSVAAIASATVAAASAWWAAQGLLPLFSPLHPGFAFAPPPTTLIPIMEMSRAPEAINDASLRATSSSSSESDDRERVEISCFTEPKPSESDKARCKKPDRSSCGSNTPSSSEVETDTVLKKHEEDKDESKQIQLDCPPPAEVHNRRSRSCCNINDSWKEVSDEGRLAFRALFSRDVLPQSFSAQDAEDTIVILGGDKEDTSLQVILGNRSSTAVTDLCDVQGSAEKAGGSASIGSGSMLSEGGHWKMKTCRTGFKPYKRCSVEAKGSGAMADGEENSSKRMRLEGEASI